MTKVDSHTTKSELKRGGKTIGYFTRVVSHDGKHLTTTMKLTGLNGEAISTREVYDKQ